MDLPNLRASKRIRRLVLVGHNKCKPATWSAQGSDSTLASASQTPSRRNSLPVDSRALLHEQSALMKRRCRRWSVSWPPQPTIALSFLLASACPLKASCSSRRLSTPSIQTLRLRPSPSTHGRRTARMQQPDGSHPAERRHHGIAAPGRSHYPGIAAASAALPSSDRPVPRDRP